MARDKINLQYLTYDKSDSVGTVTISKQNITASNGIELLKALACKDNSLAIFIENNTSSDSIVTLKAGDMQNSVLGDSQIPISANSVISLRMRDIARYEHQNGSIYFDFPAGFTGKVYASSVMPFSLKTLTNPKKEYSTADFFAQTSKGTTFGKGFDRYLKAIEAKDKQAIIQTTKDLQRNNINPEDVLNAAWKEYRKQIYKEAIQKIERNKK